MPLDSTRVTSKSAAVTDAFAEIGRANGTSMPRAKGTQERPAWEYWVSSLLAQLAELRRERAKKAAIAAGVIPDHVTVPFPVGTAEVVYAGTLVTIGVKVVAQADKINVPGLVADLEAAGVKRAVLKKLLKRHTRNFSGAHIFTASLTE
jgi:hypothetical protein